MQHLLDRFILDTLGHDPQTWPLTQGVYLAGILVVAMGLTTFGALFSGFLSFLERRVAGRMQSRIGPNRVGPAGVLQWVADAVKLIVKEDLIPADADQILFRIAPYFVVAGFIMTFVVLPFGYQLSPTSMNVGLFYVVSITALVVVGILLSGWASNSKWSVLGGIRAAAQVVSYEIPAGLVILVPIIQSGSLSLHDIIRAQGGWPWDWFMFQTPMGFAGFFIMMTALLAEGNRTPFDLPEAESEIVAGYNTEYSGMRFALFFLAEWGNLWVMGALLSTLFLGGWQVPGIGTATIAAWDAAQNAPWWFYLLSAAMFCGKTFSIVLVVVWIRWTFPRIRVDQMMSLCWKYLVPGAMGLVLLSAFTELVSFSLFGDAAKVAAPSLFSDSGGEKIRWLIHFVFFAVLGLLPFGMFINKTLQNIRIAGDRVDLSNW
jgi:NADH-quinone oxidoreductase subunit H